MLVEVSGLDKCIVCLSSDPRNVEHVIAEALGGRLTARILCPTCNSEFGRTLIPGLLADPGIILAIQNLRERLPSLHSSMTKNVR